MNPITYNYTGAIQNYTVQVAGTYDITAAGAQGGSRGASAGGLGASVGGNFALQGGDQLLFVVGQQGTNAGATGSGGGGGSFVYVDTDKSGTITQGDRLLLAAGGGGAGGYYAGNPGTAGYSADAIGGSGNGSGGAGGGTNDSNGGGGAGINGGGTNGVGTNSGSGAASITTRGASSFSAAGGYGGGGGGGFNGGGGGGGYTGGDGGGGLNNGAGGGGGGRSFDADTSATRTTTGGARLGNGQASINFVAAAPAPAPAPAPCYVTGTRIRILSGLTIQDVPVERLRVGDFAITASGKPRLIRWIGSRSYPGLTAPKHDRPVRIRTDALADGVPARELRVSPDHCLFLDGLFVAAGHLVNGHTITRGEAVAELTYWHVELDSHDLLLAENTPAESFLAAPGVRAGFDGIGANDGATASVAYASRIERGEPALAALRDRLILRAGLSIEPARLGTVRAWLDVCDGARVAGWARDDAHPDGPVCLDIRVDGVVVALALAQDYRADLAAAGLGDGRHGFDIALDEPLAPEVAHTVEVRRSADGLRVCAMAVDAAGAWTALLAA